ncbi:glutathione S-transferase T2-like [Brassica napus]|uniref:glutathione S-transferase T2-like n=1 Tax=Brassica napus TaxID=3708 RepID=UPI000BBE9642|nr:glutathione S-transferase T2-like [Brassica napus]
MGGESNDPNQTKSTTNACKETRCKWSPIEDVVLISAWLNTSNDPFVGNEQKASAFWKRIGAYYSSSPPISSLPKRESSNYKQRWQKISDSVSKFVGCYNQAVSQRTSGQSEDDVVQVAYQFYFNDYNTKFVLEHAWREHRHNQKWCSSYSSQNSKSGGSSKRTKLDKAGTFSSSSNTESNIDKEFMAHPLGVKSSKRKEKKVFTKTTQEERKSNSQSRLENLWALKEKYIAEIKKLTKMELLKSLLGETEQLSEKEETLKNKIIDEML